MKAATPRKLKGGDWGVAIQESLTRNEVYQCEVKTRSGKTWTGEYEVVYSGRGFSLAKRADGYRPAPRTTTTSRTTTSRAFASGQNHADWCRGRTCTGCH